MAWGTDDRATRVLTVTDGGESATVTIKELREGEKQDIYDALTDGFGLGKLRRATLLASITEWTIPTPLSEQSIRDLPTAVAEAIYDGITELSEGIEGENPPT